MTRREAALSGRASGGACSARSVPASGRWPCRLLPRARSRAPATGVGSARTPRRCAHEARGDHRRSGTGPPGGRRTGRRAAPGRRPASVAAADEPSRSRSSPDRSRWEARRQASTRPAFAVCRSPLSCATCHLHSAKEQGPAPALTSLPRGVERPGRMVCFARLMHRPAAFWRTFGRRRLRRQSQPDLLATQRDALDARRLTCPGARASGLNCSAGGVADGQ